MELREYTEFKKEEIIPLYESVGWVNYTGNLEMLDRAYNHSLFILAAYEEDKMVGIIRVVGDGASVVLIQDLLVLPEYQRKGIGTNLVKAVMERFSSVYQLELMTDNAPETVTFYESLGLKKAEKMNCCAFIRI